MTRQESVRRYSTAGTLVARAIDDNRLEDWVELFDEGCDYKVVTRESVEQNLPDILMWCDNRNMLRDRVDTARLKS